MKKTISFQLLCAAAVVAAVAPISVRAAAGDLYESDSGSGTIFKFTPGGTKTTFASGLNSPWGVAFDATANLFVADFTSGTIFKFTPGGTKSTFASGLTKPTGIAFDSKGNLFVAVYNGTIFEFAPDGTKSTFVSGLGVAAGLAFDPAGNLYESDSGSGTIFKFTPGGMKTTFASGLSSPGGLAFDSAGNLFEADYNGGTIFKFTPSGTKSTFASGVGGPDGLAFDSAGNLFEADYKGGTIFKFTAGGTKSTFASRLNLPRFLAFEPAQVAFPATNVLTWHNDLWRTGENLKETQLTLANVNSTNFGKLFQINVDGKVDGQPLIVSNVTVPNLGLHNVVIIATEHDTVYCCDADHGTILWRRSMLKPGETPSDPRNCDQVTPEIGITATPVIDLASGPHGTIYMVAMSKNSTSYFQRLHALDLTTGAEQFGGPVNIEATYPGSGDNNNGQGEVVFDPKQYKERPGLLVSGGIVYTFWASHCDIRPYTGWVIGYDKNTLARIRVLNLTPNGHGGAIWASGGAPAVDVSGNIYVLLGNGTFETSLDQNGFPTKSDFGNCMVKLSNVNQQLRVTDYWTMGNTVAESAGDLDLGSGNAMLLPPMVDINGLTRYLLVGAGKDKHIYIANRDNLGKFVANSNATLYQDVNGVLPGPVFSGPAYFNGRLYYGAVGDHLKSFGFTNARLRATLLSESAVTFGYPGTTPSVSANGSANAIVWAARNGNPAVLYAFDATNLARQLYASTDAGSRDNFGVGNKFIVPTVANGKVYVGTTSGVGVFGLFHPTSSITEDE